MIQGNTFTNGQAVVTTASSSVLLLGVIHVVSNDYVQYGSNDSVVVKGDIEFIVKGTAGNKNLYAAAITRNSATWLTTTSLTFKYGVS